MSLENVELARVAWKAYKERGVDGALDFYADDCVLEGFPDMPDRAAAYLGKQGFRDRYDNFGVIWEELVIDPVEFIDAGGDAVVVVTAVSGFGRGSRAPLDGLAVFAWEIRDGKIARDRAFTSRGEALEAVGSQA